LDKQAKLIPTKLQNRWHLFDDVKNVLNEFETDVSDELVYGFF
jgi:hypothetical protein